MYDSEYIPKNTYRQQDETNKDIFLSENFVVKRDISIYIAKHPENVGETKAELDHDENFSAENKEHQSTGQFPNIKSNSDNLSYSESGISAQVHDKIVSKPGSVINAEEKVEQAQSIILSKEQLCKIQQEPESNHRHNENTLKNEGTKDEGDQKEQSSKTVSMIKSLNDISEVSSAIVQKPGLDSGKCNTAEHKLGSTAQFPTINMPISDCPSNKIGASVKIIADNDESRINSKPGSIVVVDTESKVKMVDSMIISLGHHNSPPKDEKVEREQKGQSLQIISMTNPKPSPVKNLNDISQVQSQIVQNPALSNHGKDQSQLISDETTSIVKSGPYKNLSDISQASSHIYCKPNIENEEIHKSGLKRGDSSPAQNEEEKDKSQGKETRTDLNNRGTPFNLPETSEVSVVHLDPTKNKLAQRYNVTITEDHLLTLRDGSRNIGEILDFYLQYLEEKVTKGLGLPRTYLFKAIRAKDYPLLCADPGNFAYNYNPDEPPLLDQFEKMIFLINQPQLTNDWYLVTYSKENGFLRIMTPEGPESRLGKSKVILKSDEKDEILSRITAFLLADLENKQPGASCEKIEPNYETSFPVCENLEENYGFYILEMMRRVFYGVPLSQAFAGPDVVKFKSKFSEFIKYFGDQSDRFLRYDKYV